MKGKKRNLCLILILFFSFVTFSHSHKIQNLLLQIDHMRRLHPLALALICSSTLFSQHHISDLKLVPNTKPTVQSELYSQARENCLTPLVVDSFPSGFSSTTGIAFDGENLWVTGILSNRIDQFTLDGEFLNSIETEVQFTGGMTFALGHLWLSDYSSERIHKIDTSNGESLLTFLSPADDLQGIDWDGNHFWITDRNESRIYKLNEEGDNLNSFNSIVEPQIDGIIWDGSNFWLLYLIQINKISANGQELLECFTVPGGPFILDGTYDGQFFWTSSNATQSVYKIDVNNVLSDSRMDADAYVDEIRILPNPFESTFVVEDELSNIIGLHIFNSQGVEQVIRAQFSSSKIQVEGSHLPKGLYIVSIELKTGEIKNFKIIKS